MRAILVAVLVIIATMALMVAFNNHNEHRLDHTATNFVARMSYTQPNMN